MQNHFSWSVRVYYEDTDAGGLVYYANYLKFLERARTEWLRHLGFEQNRLRQAEGMIFVVRQVQLEYLQAARLDDLLQVSVHISQLGRASLTMQQAIMRGAVCLCTANIKLACLQADGFKPRALPAKLLAAFKELQ